MSVTGQRLTRFAAVLDGCPSIVARSSGPFGVVATHDVGGRIDGIRPRDGRLEVRVVMSAASTVPLVQADVLAATAAADITAAVDLHIDDIAEPVAALTAGPVPAPVPQLRS